MIRRLRFLALLPSLLLLISCGPVPGGSLAGTPTPVPETWRGVVDDLRVCEIQSRPADPHSIQLECFLYEDQLHVQSHRWVSAPWWPGTSWALIWQDHPDVIVRLGDKLYSLTAVPVVDPARRAAILRARDYDPPPEGIVVFEFQRPDAT